MKALLKYSVLVLATALPAALIAKLLGSSLVGQSTIEAALAAFAVAGLMLTVVSDYSYQRRRDVFASHQFLKATERQLKAGTVRNQRPCVAPLTANR